MKDETLGESDYKTLEYPMKTTLAEEMKIVLGKGYNHNDPLVQSYIRKAKTLRRLLLAADNEIYIKTYQIMEDMD